MNQPVSEQDHLTAQATGSESEVSHKAHSKNKNVQFQTKWLITAGLLLVIIPLLISVLSQKKKITPPHPETTVIATVGNQPIYLTDIQKVALEQYQPEAIDREVLRISYDTLTERLILDKAAKDLHLSVSDQEVLEALNRNGTPKDEITDLLKKDTKYDLLRNKILRHDVESREAYSIGFYIASYDEQQGSDVTDQERALFAQQREDGKQALAEIETRLKEGEIPITIAKDIYNKYPSLQSVLAVNGYILQTNTDQSVVTNPKLYTYEKDNVGQPFFDAIYTMPLNGIKSVNEDDGSGGYVILMKSVNHANIRNYDDWLAQKKKDLVKENVTL